MGRKHTIRCRKWQLQWVSAPVIFVNITLLSISQVEHRLNVGCWHDRWRSSTTLKEKFIAFEKCTTTTGAGEKNIAAPKLSIVRLRETKCVDGLRYTPSKLQPKSWQWTKRAFSESPDVPLVFIFADSLFQIIRSAERIAAAQGRGERPGARITTGRPAYI